jgi:hypothetical protein
MIFFARYRTPVYLLAALPVTLIALLLVHQMPIAMPSSIDPLVPVLRDNFWLTIHVLTITLSYAPSHSRWASVTFCSGATHGIRRSECGRADAFLALSRPPAWSAFARRRHDFRWRVGELFVGPILGLGPEGNMGPDRAALLYSDVAWTARRLVDEFGLVVASVVCFLAVLMAWYGVNFVLGKGLHSYGFGIGGETYVATFVIADLLFVCVCDLAISHEQTRNSYCRGRCRGLIRGHRFATTFLR